MAEIKIRACRNLSLTFSETDGGQGEYPTSRIQKGLLLNCGEETLCEEGLGFGVPLLKFKDREIFPGRARTTNSTVNGTTTIIANYELNLGKKLVVKGRKIKNRTVYEIEDYFGRLHREHPALRNTVDWWGNRLRKTLGVEGVFEEVEPAGNIAATYTISEDGATLHVSMDFARVKKEGLAEIIVANEQGANYFAGYRDSDGKALLGEKIGSWDEVTAGRASFIDSGNRVTFSLANVEKAKLLRGRELVSGRLAWAGLNYVLPPESTVFSYDITLGTFG